MGKRLGWAVILWILASGASAQPTAALKGIDLYRSDAVTAESLQAKFAPLLQTYMRLRAERRAGGRRAAEKLKAEIEGRVRRLGSFAYVNLYYAEYVTSAEYTAYVTFDVVDAKDAKTRMPFRAAPSAKVRDPKGLLASWRQYSDLGMKLMSQGLLSMDRAGCPGYFCLWGSATPELGALEKSFVDGVEPHKKELTTALRKAADPQKRAAAVYLLSYLQDGKEVADLTTEALADPSEAVRGAALQVISDISLYHKSIFIDIGRVLTLLDDPSTPNRSRALGLVIGLADNPAYRPYVLARAPAYLLGLLKMRQPSVHDLAFTLLLMLSKETYDRRDYPSWEKWISLQPSSSTAPSAPAAK